MSFEINTIKCPQCGSTKHSAQQQDHYVCLSCQAEFVVESSLAPKQHIVTHTIDQALLDAFGRFKKKALLFLMALLVLFFVLIFISIVTSSSAEEIPEKPLKNKGASVTTLYQEEKPTTWLITAVVEGGGSNQVVELSVSDLFNGTKLSKQRLNVAPTENSVPIAFKRLPNGGLYAVFMGREVHRFNPKSREFDAINQELQQSFSEALHLGIRKVATCYGGEERACLEIMSNDGVSYVYYPMMKQLILKKEDYRASYANMQALIQQPQRLPHYFVAEVNKRSKAPQEGVFLLKGQQPAYNGGPYRMGEITIFKPSLDASAIQEMALLSGLSQGFAVFSAQEPSYEQVTEVTPDQRYSEAKILADNAQQVLLMFTSEPLKTEYFVQGIDKKTDQVIWRKPLTDFVSIEDQGSSVYAEAHQNGFLMMASAKSPSVLVDHKGQIVKTLKP